MDADAVRGKTVHDTLIQAFEQQRLNVLVGTQMVVEGLDFDNVSLVGVLDADGLLNFADFRANERAFQLMEQVSRRAGRKGAQGKVIILAMKIIIPFYFLCSSMITGDYMILNWRTGSNFSIRPSAG